MVGSLPSLLSVAQVAEIAGLAVATIRHWMWRSRKGLRLSQEAQALVACARTCGRSVRFDSEAVAEWIERGRRSIRPRPAGADGDLLGDIRAIATRAREAGRPALAVALDAVADLVGGASCRGE